MLDCHVSFRFSDVVKVLSVPLPPPSDLLALPLRQASRVGRGGISSVANPIDVVGSAVDSKGDEKTFSRLKR